MDSPVKRRNFTKILIKTVKFHINMLQWLKTAKKKTGFVEIGVFSSFFSTFASLVLKIENLKIPYKWLSSGERSTGILMTTQQQHKPMPQGGEIL